ncbi:MAG: S8 family serine peptidase, partial [Bdellovibrio sp.]|nr:S8 family serine peptidase [Bdellovibrio sp.]
TVGWNGKGSRGVAPKASLQVANLLSSTVTQTNAKIYDQASGDFDVLNMSWGTDQNNLSDPDTTYEGFLKTAVTDNRGGKGAILVKAAGNDFSVGCHNNTSVACVGNANFDGDNKNPYTIVVSALNATGYSASYSSGGSNVWISGFGGQYGDTSPAMFTTDRTGCSAGWSQSSTSTTISFQKGGGQNSQCNYTVTFNGTSSAAPTVSGAVALILEANPQLTWRDVKYILARTAVPMDYVTTGGISHPKGVSLPSGYVWEMPWIVNGAGFKFQNWYGFGKVDVDAAVKMAQKYTSNLGSYNEESWGKHTLSGLSIGIPDNSATGGQSSMVVASADNLKIESVRLKISVTHPNISELALELTSPSGTKSILVNARNSLVGISDYDNDIFLSNAFYQEKSAGTWKLRVVDALGGNTGTITSWSLNFTGGK